MAKPIASSGRPSALLYFPGPMFEKVLVANRGEIAIRVMRALREMGILSVGVYSEADRETPHVRIADEAHLLGPAVPAESYLSIERIIEVAKESGAEAVHPGYGFLAENAAFATALDEAGIVFIGPPASAIEAMGSKTRAREIMQEAGVPIVPGSTEPSPDVEAALKTAAEIGYPVACKAAGRRRRQGLPRRDERGRARRRLRGRRPRGREVLLRRPRLSRALPRGPAPRRGPGARRLARQRHPPRRARLLDSAPPPEADRGGARPARRRGDARADRQDRHRGRARRRLPRRRHDRGDAGRRRLLLPRDEHPGPGRALRHRDGDRDRHRPRAGADRRRRGALDRPGRRPHVRARDRVPDQRRGRAQELRPGAGKDRELHRARRARRPGRLRARGRRRGDAALRPDGREADHLGRRPREGDARGCCGRSTSTGSSR